jgi:hypothetical protein
MKGAGESLIARPPVEKFHWLSEAFADKTLRNRLVRVVRQLDVRPISDLTDLLGHVQCRRFDGPLIAE